MSMQLTLAKVDVTLLGAIREEPDLLDWILGNDSPPPDGLATFDGEQDVFTADYRTLAGSCATAAQAGKDVVGGID
jgi:hypothetical protein